MCVCVCVALLFGAFLHRHYIFSKFFFILYFPKVSLDVYSVCILHMCVLAQGPVPFIPLFCVCVCVCVCVCSCACAYLCSSQ